MVMSTQTWELSDDVCEVLDATPTLYCCIFEDNSGAMEGATCAKSTKM
jgi:hypothetical protein